MALVAIDLVEGFLQSNATSFEFYLNEWQAIDEQGYVIPIFVLTLDSDLLSDLKAVLTPVLAI